MTRPGAKHIVDPRMSDAVAFGGATLVLAAFAFYPIRDHSFRWQSLDFPPYLLSILAGLAVSVWLFRIVGHPYRGLGVFVWLGLLAVVAAVTHPILWYAVFALSIIGVACSEKYILVARRAGRLTWNPMSPVPSGSSILIGIACVGFAVYIVSIGRVSINEQIGHESVTLAASIGFVLAACVRLFRPAFEWFFVIGMGVMYRISGRGPGIEACPPVGPVLVISNHVALLDPIIIQKVIPRPVIGLMSSLYYDRWYVKTQAKWIFRVIRVPDSNYRHEAPEIRESVIALDRGDLVMIFPEGWLRRKEEVPLRRFGQGTWQLLHQRPETPVIACWIEGVWGSYFSHKDGPLMTNKRFDLQRPIQVGVSYPIIIPPDIVADQLATRFYLMNLVSQARTHIGLPALPEFLPDSTTHAERDDGERPIKPGEDGKSE